ncbi:MAG: glycosyltransferase family 4 protein [Bryobacteraceae bacterium]
MRIAVLNNCVPFLYGGAEYLADALARKFREYGHESTVIKIPFRWDPPSSVLEQILAARLLRLPNTDLAVAFKFPAYYIPHPNKVLWLLHQFRQAYDLWGTEFQSIPDTPGGRAVRDAIVRADNAYLPEARRIFTNSKVTGDRLRKFNGIESEVLLPPLLSDAVYRGGETGDAIVALGRVNGAKRQLLLVQAMKHCRTPVRLIVAGKSESPQYAAAIQAEIRKHRLADRVEFVDRFISDEEKIGFLSGSLACAYIPYDEDSYGYVTLEACLSRKAVVTCSDSGGIEALVRPGETGLIAEPDPQALAAAFDELHSDKGRATRMGAAGEELAKSLRINWDNVIRTLTGAAS